MWDLCSQVVLWECQTSVERTRQTAESPYFIRTTGVLILGSYKAGVFKNHPRIADIDEPEKVCTSRLTACHVVDGSLDQQAL